MIYSDKKNSKNNSEHKLILRIISTWGSLHVVGLTGLELFSETGNKIPLKLCNISLRNHQ